MDSDTTKRVMPKRVAHVQLPEPYSMFGADLWVNLPQPLWRQLMSPDFEQCAAAFGQMVVSHDLVDHEGAPFPPGGSPELYRELPAELVRVISDARIGQIGKLSKSRAE